MPGTEFLVILVMYWVHSTTNEQVVSHIVYPNMPACLEGIEAGKKVFEAMNNNTAIMKCQKAMVAKVDK